MMAKSKYRMIYFKFWRSVTETIHFMLCCVMYLAEAVWNHSHITFFLASIMHGKPAINFCIKC